MANGRPDLSGIWAMEHDHHAPTNGLGCEPPSPEFLNIAASVRGGLPFQPWAAELVKARRSDTRRVSPVTQGKPLGIVLTHTFPLLRKVAQSPDALLILSEYNSAFRQVFTDGRLLPVDPNPSWNGYSSGGWDSDDVLVVNTIGFRDDTWLDIYGNPLTEAGKITERFRRISYGTLEIELTVDDPRAYTRPWTVTLRQEIVLDTELLESHSENEKDIQHLGAR